MLQTKGWWNTIVDTNCLDRIGLLSNATCHLGGFWYDPKSASMAPGQSRCVKRPSNSVSVLRYSDTTAGCESALSIFLHACFSEVD